MQASDFKQLFLPCHRKLFSVAYRLMSNAQAAEDMVQETFLKLWMQRDKIEKVDNPEAYSITVLRRIFYDKMRARHLQEVDKDVGSLQVSSSQNISKQLEEADEIPTRKAVDYPSARTTGKNHADARHRRAQF